ncbi:hypothetical protein BGX29_003091 [Mortierella sp. GBA35]|nr:hypothetical protein BGX23_009306 [Mortierella sp. AD031]KAF9103674.1 hypothetical protein BGX29_003091 [Mortierella sp. GBA35]KAG0205128.1 hypothetical protein BGX33_008097 [Mortierella sp. NVP41]
MSSRIAVFLVAVAALSLKAFVFSNTQKSLLDSLSPLLLGFLLGLVVAETPLASPLQEFCGLTSRHPDKVGLDIIHAANTSSQEGKATKSHLDQRVMYGLQHAFLNLEVTGWWFNMGLWDKAQSPPMRFQDACKALVKKVTSQLDINSDSHILDVGFGCGDQDVYMAQLHRPARITGITIEAIQHHAAQDLVKRTPTQGTDINLYVADASKLPQFLDSTPNVFASGTPSTKRHFSHVVSIDSAYHYNTRAQFLKNAAQVLAPNTGRLALADMILAKPAPNSGLGLSIFKAVFGAMEVPAVNMKMMDEYRQDLIDAGFVDIEIECIEDRVFSGLATHIQNQTSRFGGMVGPGVKWTYAALSKGLWWLDRSKWLHFVVVKARNGPARA